MRPGFLYGLGSGLGQFAQNFQAMRDQQTLQALRQLQLQDYQRQQQQEQQEGRLFSQLLGGLGQMGGGQQVQPLPAPQVQTAPVDTDVIPSPSGATPSQPPAPRYTPAPQSSGFSSGLSDLSPPVGSPENQRITDLIIRDESGGRNIPQQVVGPQGGYNPSTGTITGPSSAQGLGQFIDSTWRDAASRVPGASQYAHAMDAPEDVQRSVISQRVADKGVGDWAPYNATLRRDLGISGGGRGAGAGGAAPMQQEVMQTAQATAQSIDPFVQGRMALSSLAQRIEQIAPNADPVVKMHVLERLNKMLAPDQTRMWEMFKLQHADALAQQRIDEQRRRDDLAERRFEATVGRQGRSTVVLQDGTTVTGMPGDGRSWTTMTGKPLTPEQTQELETGRIGKLGTGAAQPLDATQAKFWGQVIGQGGSLPPGLRRSGVVEQIMKEVPGSANMTPGDFIARHAEVAANTTSLRNLQKMSDSAISFEKLAEKNFDVALSLAPDAVPTDLGPFFNRWIEEGETMFGDPNVPPYVAAVITGANEYAKVMSGSTGTAASTVDSRREARDLFSPYLSQPQIRNVVAVAKADMKNRENTLNEQVGQIQQRLGSTQPTTVAPPARPQMGAPQQQTGPQEGDTATNPQTREKLVYRNGQWVPTQ